MLSRTSLQRFGLGAALYLLAAACGSDEQTRLYGYGFPCAASSECAADLTCRYDRCRQRCDQDADCELGVCLRQAGQTRGVCAQVGEKECSKKTCLTGLTCAADDFCRQQCQSGDDCATGDVCEESACVRQ